MVDTEGLVEVCVNGTYYTVSLDNGRFSVREASVICQQLGFGNGKLITGSIMFGMHMNLVWMMCACIN
jgi:hypothetical protein